MKFPTVFGATHVFILPYIEQDNLYKAMYSAATPSHYVPSIATSNQKVVPTYVCPADPSLSDGLRTDAGALAGASYAVNAQVFGTLTGAAGAQDVQKNSGWDGGLSIGRILDGSSNTIFFLHVISGCGDSTAGMGTAWGFTAGDQTLPINAPSANAPYPVARSSILGMTNLATHVPFQNMPSPWQTATASGLTAPPATGCNYLQPATPHSSAFMCLLGDASVRSCVPSITAQTFWQACMPNDGLPMPSDW